LNGQLCYPTGPDLCLCTIIMRPAFPQTILIILMAGIASSCHIEPPVTEGYLHQQSLRGKSKEQVLACAGAPLQERQVGTSTLLRYYREAPLLEESMVSSKSSRPTVHHGCWATVVVHEHHVDQVQYRFVPSSVDASNDCEEIFADCQE